VSRVAKKPVLMRVSRFPEDFQQLLMQLFEDGDAFSVSVPLPARIRVHQANVADHIEEFEANLDDWTWADHSTVAEYSHAMRQGEVFPPLVAESPRGLLRDGYHRLGACRLLGVQHVPMIYLCDYDPEGSDDYT